MEKTVLITGATGMVGQVLTQHLLQKNYTIHCLSRSKNTNTLSKNIKVFEWDTEKNLVALQAFENVNTIIHLAGENIADQKWSLARKAQIVNSRVKSTELILNALQKIDNTHIKTYIGASATGIYGNITNPTLLAEDAFNQQNTGTNISFLQSTTQAWESAHQRLITAMPHIRPAILRIGVVLHPQQGALPKMATPIRLGAVAALGSGKQYLPWIHIYDLVQLITYIIENKHINGTFNVAAPHIVTNYEFTKVLAKQLNRGFLPILKLPEMVLKMALGEMADILLSGQPVSAKKITTAGFEFKYNTLEKALQNLYPK